MAEKINKRQFLGGIKNFAIGTVASAAIPVTEAHGATSSEVGRDRSPDTFPRLEIKPEMRGLVEDFLAQLALVFEKNPSLTSEVFLKTRAADFGRIMQTYVLGYVQTLGVVREGEKLTTPLGIQNRALGIALALSMNDRKLDERVKDFIFVYWNDIAEQLERATVFGEGQRG